jgi:hypothetical protein
MGMAFHRFVVVASLPATFPTLGRVHPNMTEQAALTRVNIGQQTLILYHGGGPSFEWAGGWVGKGEAILGFEDLLAQRHGGTPRGIFRGHGLRWQRLTSMCRNRVSDRRAFAEV